MGTAKKERNRLAREGKTGSMDNVKIKGENFYRDAKRVRALNIRKDHGPQRNAEGKITQAAKYQSRDAPVARIEPNRKWFQNTRVISQESLTQFREAMAERASDPYSVLLKSNKLPMTLIRDGSDIPGLKQHQAKMTIETSSFADTFGPKAQRKRVKLGVSSLTDLAENSETSMDTYKDRLEQAKLLSGVGDTEQAGEDSYDLTDALSMAIEPVFSKGQSKRIWNELYKVLDSSDVVLHVLDARNPEGTRCRAVEQYLKKEAPHKHLVFILNKVDLIPTSVAAAWVRHLSKEVPTLAFHSSINNSFGKGQLISLLRQFSSLHKERKQISVGLIGYPNVGKSSLINTLKAKKVATVAPIPGETKVWQFVTLMKRIYLIDCPGIVPPNANDKPVDILLRGVVRIEKVENPEQYIAPMMEKVKRHHLERTYEITNWKDHHEFLELLGRKGGRLLKAGEVDMDGVAKMVLTDFMRGKIPWFTPAPKADDEDATVIEGREGRLGEMPKKRKRDGEDGVQPVAKKPTTAASQEADPASEDTNDDDEEEEEDDEFAGFSEDDEPAGTSKAKQATEETGDDEDDMIPLEELSDSDDESSDGEENG
ncbi:NGP1NT domain-containing protein [Xylariaceae sp. FL0594]|nr:NGP1NT domain-containing protein [Xylariaceae sp. FL0594]